MPCDTRLKKIWLSDRTSRQQTIQERAAEVRKRVANLGKQLVAGTVKVKIGPQGAVAFVGWSDSERDGVTDACAYRRLMVSGTAQEKAAFARAEMLSGRAINRQVVGHGVHSHDGGHTWHGHKG